MIERFLIGLAAKMEDPDDVECSVGGGTLWLDELDEDGEQPEDHNGPVYTVLDVDAADLEATRAILRLNLPELGAPAGTLIQFGGREDRFDGERWHLDEPPSVDEI